MSAHRVIPRSVSRAGAGLIGAACITIGVATVAAPAMAQCGAALWTATVRPTVNALPIGSCGAVSLSLLDPGSPGWPRTAGGGYVSVPDLDRTVTSRLVSLEAENAMLRARLLRIEAALVVGHGDAHAQTQDGAAGGRLAQRTEGGTFPHEREREDQRENAPYSQ